MGEKLSKSKQLEQIYLMNTFVREDVQFVKGDGPWLFDDNGKRYLDFLAGIGVVSVGHTNERVTRAICDQAQELLHVSNFFYVDHRAEVAKELSDLTHSDKPWKAFFANSGAEANEGAIKLARGYMQQKNKKAYKIISANNSFHGRTIATVAATGQDKFHKKFLPVAQGFLSVPFNDLDALRKAIDDETCAVLLECIQGESGVWPATQEYLTGVRQLCDERGILLIIDEVQTGLYRTGKPYCFQNYDITPDIFTLAKGIANGVPCGALLAQEEVAGAFVPGDHGTTFGGSPLAMAAAHATLQEFSDRNMGEHVQTIGSYLKQELSDLHFAIDVRGKGLMQAISLDKPCAPAMLKALLGFKEAVVVNAPKEDIIRFLPPLIIEKNHVDMLIEALKKAYKSVN